jgi:sec-independent protein translocase protein TatA
MKLFEGPGLIIILAIVLIIFGPGKLPELGKSLGKTMKSIRDGMEGVDEASELKPDGSINRSHDATE